METIRDTVVTLAFVVFAVYSVYEHGRAEALRAEMGVYKSYAQDNYNTDVYPSTGKRKPGRG